MPGGRGSLADGIKGNFSPDLKPGSRLLETTGQFGVTRSCRAVSGIIAPRRSGSQPLAKFRFFFLLFRPHDPSSRDCWATLEPWRLCANVTDGKPSGFDGQAVVFADEAFCQFLTPACSGREDAVGPGPRPRLSLGHGVRLPGQIGRVRRSTQFTNCRCRVPIVRRSGVLRVCFVHILFS